MVNVNYYVVCLSHTNRQTLLFFFSFFFCQRQRNLSFKLLFLYTPKKKKEKKVVISIYSGSMSDPLASSLPLMSACACTGVHDN